MSDIQWGNGKQKTVNVSGINTVCVLLEHISAIDYWIDDTLSNRGISSLLIMSEQIWRIVKV